MPINKHAYIRYQTLDRCFRNTGRKFFIEDLIEECFKDLSAFDPSISSLSRRQVFYDIKFMESKDGWSIPIEKPREDKKAYYHYSDHSYSILNQPPSKTELEQIELAKMVMARLSTLDEFEWMNELVTRLEESFFETGGKVMDFGRNIYLEGLNRLGKLYYSIINKQVLEITYKPFHKNESIITIFHPHYLKQFNNRWFLIGHIDGFQSLTNYPLDRIEKIKEVDLKYEELEIDFEEYFDDVIGVTRNIEDEPIDIKLLFSPARAPYILTKPFHSSQTTLHNEENLTILIKVIPNRELISQIMSFGDDVTVISPDSIREQIKEKLKNSLSRY